MSRPPADPSAGPVEEFRAAVQEAFGMSWRVDRTVEGFEARLAHELDPERSGEGVTASDDTVIRVAVDPDSRSFSWSTGREAALDRDRTRRSRTGYRRDVDASRSSGSRRTWSFRRTPEGLVPDLTAVEDSAGRAADVRRVAADLGWTEAAGSGAGAGIADLPPKRTLALIGVFVVVVVLIIVGIGAVIVVNVVGAFPG